jgi:hypothetical protein
MPDDVDKFIESLPEPENEWLRVVATLTKLTEQGKLEWKSAAAHEALKNEPNSKIEAVYLCEYKNKRLRLYAEVVKVDVDPMLRIGPFRNKASYYERQIILQMGDKSAHGWYTVSNVDPYTLEDLLESVKYRVLGVEDFLDDILEADKTPTE